MTNSKIAEQISLKGTPETIGIDLLAVRNQMVRQGCTGLGPPDLVLLSKSTDQAGTNAIKTCHYLSGLSIANPSSFPAYFASITQKIPKNLMGLPKYSITEGECCCWNSFANVDIHITVKNPGSCNFYVVTPNEEQYKISDLTWRELSICTTLRFWRASEPLFAELFDFNPIAVSGMRVVTPNPLSVDDIRFAVVSHRPSDELDVAIAHAILSIGDRKQVISLMRDVVSKAPRLIIQLLRFIPEKMPVYSELYQTIRDFFFVASDDVILAVGLVQCALKRGDIDACNIAVPLLLNSLWSEPRAGIALAAIARARNRPEDSLYFLNAVCLCRSPAWESSVITLPSAPTTREKSGLKTASTPIEQYLCISHLCGISFLFHRGIAELALDIGPIRLQTLLKHKEFTAKSSIPYLPDVTFYHQLSSPAEDALVCELDAYNLFDPGIEGEAVPQRIIKKMPTSQKLIDACDFVLKNIAACEALKKAPNFGNELEAMKAAIIALRVGDLALAQIALDSISTPSVVAELLKMRTMCETHWTSLSGIFKEHKKSQTLNEANSAIVAKEIAVALEAFII